MHTVYIDRIDVRTRSAKPQNLPLGKSPKSRPEQALSPEDEHLFDSRQV